MQTVLKTRKIKDIKVTSVVFADVSYDKPIVFYPGVQANYRKVNRRTKTFSNYLMECYLKQREVAGVDSCICDAWSLDSIDEL